MSRTVDSKGRTEKIDSGRNLPHREGANSALFSSTLGQGEREVVMGNHYKPYFSLPNFSLCLTSSPLAVKPAEEPSTEKKAVSFWDVFANKWQQTAALEKMAMKPDIQEQVAEESEASGEAAVEEATHTTHDNDLREAEGVAFKWSFLTSKLAEIKNKNIPKSN